MTDDVPDKPAVQLLASRPVKRSFSVAGHKTSISLEAAFWDAFRDLCREDGVALAAQIAAIDRQRGSAAGLSGAVRVWILERYRSRVEPPDEGDRDSKTNQDPAIDGQSAAVPD